MNPFREALKHLWDGVDEHSLHYMHICHCLTVKENGTLGRAARCYVERLLDGHYTVGQWLVAKVPDAAAFAKSTGWKWEKELQAYRKRWLTHLANQYDAGEIKL